MKKKTSKQPPLLSPENYIRQKARNLPIVECLITPEWEDCGECNIIVVRQHVNSNYTFGLYLVDTYCLGVKDVGYYFNVSEDSFKDTIKKYSKDLETITYNEAHNIIYGALAYAEDLGFRPHKDFAVAKYILEEDSDEIPLIEYEFGCDGKPLLIVDTVAEKNRYLPTLEKAVGDDYDIFVKEEDDDDDYDEDYDDEEDYDEEDEEFDEKMQKYFESLSDEQKIVFQENLKKFQENFEKSKLLPRTPYNYQYPDYPQTLELTHKELEILFDAEHNEILNKKTLDTILSLPRETLIKDLENCILYEIGRNCRDISEQNSAEDLYGSISHALLLLAELKSEESLPVVLEVLRQSDDFSDFFFGDFASDTIIPILYQIGRNRLDALSSYLKEPNLSVFFKMMISPVLGKIFLLEPERQPEIIAWYDDILDFLYEKRDDINYCDANLTGMIIIEPMDFCATELLPKIKRLFDLNLVDEMACGNYDDMEKEMNKGIVQISDNPKIQSIYEIYKEDVE